VIQRRFHVRPFLCLWFAICVGCVGCGGDEDTSGSEAGGTEQRVPLSDIEELTFESFTIEVLESLGSGYLAALATKSMKGNPWTREKANLGRYLFFDTRLSKDLKIACATCHSPSTGWTDGLTVSEGIGGQQGRRNVPAVVNRIFGTSQFWDGRATSLAAQAGAPIESSVEMGDTHESVVRKISAVTGYGPLFRAAFGDEQVDIDRITKAIASFERTIVSYDSAYDRWKRDPRRWSLSASAQRGRRIFFDTNKSRCSACHSGPNFTDEAFHNVGVGMSTADPGDPDEHRGRGAVTGRQADMGRYKTPTLRNVADTAPYMHDGSVKTLEDVVNFYAEGGVEDPAFPLDEKMRALVLTDREKADLVAFMKTLTGRVTKVSAPQPLD